MKITVVALGSRGDTQPYLALAQALQVAGHDVRFCAGDNFEGFVRAYGLEFSPIGIDMQHITNVRIPEVMETGRNTIEGIRMMVQEGITYLEPMQEGVHRASEGTEAVFANILGIGTYNIAEANQLPLFWIHSTPVLGYTAYRPPIILPFDINLGKPLNSFVHRLTEFFMWQMLKRPMNQWRKSDNLQTMKQWTWPLNQLGGQAVPNLYGYSPHVLGKPADWSDEWHVTGYWFLDAPEEWQPPSELLDFLDSGSPPVYIGFGSMSNRDPEKMTELVLAALNKSGQRGLLFSGWGGVSDSDMPHDVFLMPSAPHDWIFPRMKAVVHHGGVGTTAAGLRAGVPSLVVPFFGDQYFWGNRVYKLGVGAKPIPRNKLTVDKLAQAIQTMCTDEATQIRASELGEKIRLEKGKTETVHIIEQYLEDFYQN